MAFTLEVIACVLIVVGVVAAVALGVGRSLSPPAPDGSGVSHGLTQLEQLLPSLLPS